MPSTVIISILLLILATTVITQNYAENYEDMINAVLSNDIEIQNNVDDTVLLTEEMKPKPMSIMSGEIPKDVIKKLADYLFSLLQGTGEIKKRTITTTSTAPPTTIQFLPFRKPDIAVVGFQKRSRRFGISRKKKMNMYGSRKLKNGKI